MILRSLKRAGVCDYFVAIYNTFVPFDVVEMYFDCVGFLNLLGRRGCFYNDYALVVAPHAFPYITVIFRGRAKGNLIFFVL